MTQTPRRPELAEAFLDGGGQMGAHMRAHDWASTPLGPPAGWPQALKTALRLLLNTGHPMYIWWGPDLLCLYNDAYSRSIGPERHPGSLGQRGREVWAEIWPIIGPQVDQVVTGGGPTWNENALVPITRHGRREDVYWTYSYGPIDDQTAPGGIGGVLVVCTETTDQVLQVKKTATELESFAELFEQAPTFMAMLRGPEHRFERVNPGYMKLIENRQVLGRTVAEALPEAAAQGFVDLLDEVYRSGEPYAANGVTYLLQSEPGEAPRERQLDFVYQPIKDGHGRVTGIFVVGADVTLRALADAVIREREAQFQTLAEAMLNHVWTALPDGRLNWFNRRVYEYSGAAPGELDGGRWTAIVHPDDVDAAGRRWADSIASGEPYETEFRLRRADGVYRWHIARAVALRSEGGTITAWIGTNTDIEDQKGAAQALASLNETLKQEVELRTGELMAAEEALRQSHKMEAVGQLTGGIAHDFNNLLTAISGSLELIQRRLAEGRGDGLESYIDAAQGAGRRAAALTQRLLAFSRRQTLDPRPTDLNRVVSGMEDLIRRTVGPAIETRVEVAEGLWPTLIDAVQIDNALLNLCINARDAMPSGGTLTIRTENAVVDDDDARRDLEPGHYVRLCVVDSGVGIEPAALERIFDPFYTTKPLGEGTGLGLSMVYGFVRQSGGHVRVCSEPGRGTELSLYLPRYDGTATDQAPAAAETAQTRTEEGETILLVEDELAIRMYVDDVLSEAGYRVLCASDGREALALLQPAAAAVDLLVTDVGLPGGMNGRQLADAGRTLRGDLKILFITGFAENAAFGNGRLAPGMALLTKPFSGDDLLRRIREVLTQAD